MNDEQLLRYSRQMMLPEIDAAGQERLNESRVLIIGLGGLGSPVSIYLSSAGVAYKSLGPVNKNFNLINLISQNTTS